MLKIAKRFDWETNTEFVPSSNVNEKSNPEPVNGCLGYRLQGGQVMDDL